MDARWTGANLGAALILSLAAAGALTWRAASGRFELGQSPAPEERRVEAARERVNPNTASIASLRRLPGLGPVRAQDILGYRQASGRPTPFRFLKDLENVHGIGPATAENLRDHLEFPPMTR
jgi:competence ComEA-like helix-hairpin-helix protein